MGQRLTVIWLCRLTKQICVIVAGEIISICCIFLGGMLHFACVLILKDPHMQLKAVCFGTNIVVFILNLVFSPLLLEIVLVSYSIKACQALALCWNEQHLRTDCSDLL